MREGRKIGDFVKQRSDFAMHKNRQETIFISVYLFTKIRSDLLFLYFIFFYVYLFSRRLGVIWPICFNKKNRVNRVKQIGIKH